MTKKLILFDIDRTLLGGSSKAHKDAFSYAFKKVYGIDASIDEIDAIGKTDTGIIIEILEKRGLSREKITSRLSEAYETMRKHFRENIASSEQKPCMGVENLLPALKERGYILGLVTGNLEEIAELKLKKSGLLKFFELGGFGEVSEKRSALVKEAIKKAETKYGEIRKGAVFVVGDSPHDVECGKANNVKTIAVLTGVHSREEIARLKPDYILDNLEDSKEFINCIEE